MLGFRNKEIYYQDYYSELAKYNNLVQQTILKNRFLSLKIYEFETKESMYYEYKVVIDEKLTSYWYEYSLIDYEYNNRKSNYFISENGYFTYVNDVDINGEIDVRLKFFSYSYIKNKSQEDLTVEDVDIDLMIGLYFINEGFGSAFIDDCSEYLMIFSYFVELPLAPNLFIAYFKDSKKNNHIYGIVSESGQIIIPFKYSNISLLNSKIREVEDDSLLYYRSDLQLFNEVIFTFLLENSENGAWQIINSDLQVLAENLYNLKFVNYSDRIVAMKYIDSKYYICLLDKNGFLLTMIEGAKFDVLNEYIVIESKDEYTFVNTISGSIILRTDFYKLEALIEPSFYDEDIHVLAKYLIIKIDNNFGLYDWSFREILSPVYQEISRIKPNSNKMEFRIVKNNRVESFIC